MNEALNALRQTLAEGEDAVLCTIIGFGGSTPRETGAQMLVRRNGPPAGTVGGGAGEHAAELRARRVLDEGRPAVEKFAMHPGEGDTGMICGGEITVAFAPFAGGDREALAMLDTALALSEGGEEAWLVTRMDGERWVTGTFDTGAGVRFLPGTAEHDLAPLLTGDGAADGTCFTVPLTAGGTVYLFGGGHVSRELAALLAHLDFRVAVWDDRPEFADPRRFPMAAEVTSGDYETVGQRLRLYPRDCVVVMTQGHLGDFTVLRQTLGSPAAYIGCIGSRRKHAVVCEKLAACGFSPENIGRIHSPIGLPILAQTPAEIAVSIAAELIEHRARRRGK